MQRLLVLAVCVAAAGCHPKLSVGYDATAHTRGPLANLQTISRVEAVTGADAPAPAMGRNYSLGLGFGDKNFTIGALVNANNVSGSTLEINGPQYVTGSAALDFRYSWLRIKNFSAGMQLAPTRTILVDSTSGEHSWGSGVRFGGGIKLTAKSFSIYADAYQEKMIFVEGPAQGMSTRTGMTLGVAFQP
jgi:hypothetical protein